MKYLLLLIISVWLFSSCNNGEITFERIDIDSEVSNYPNKKEFFYSESYIIYNYNYKTNNIYEEKIDSFVCQLIASDTIDYERHWVSFYNKSRKTNVPYIEKHHDDWFSYALDHDLIVSYEFKNSKFSYRSYGTKPGFEISTKRFNCN